MCIIPPTYLLHHIRQRIDEYIATLDTMLNKASNLLLAFKFRSTVYHNDPEVLLSSVGVAKDFTY